MGQQIELPECLACLFEPHRYKILYGGRGGGKSWGVAQTLIILGNMKPLRILCARETMSSIAQSVHALLGDTIRRMGYESVRGGPGYTIQKDRIYNHLGTVITFAQLKHNIHNIKGIESSDIVWIEEAANVSKHSWSLLRPTIRKEGSEIWATFNPSLSTDYAYKNFVLKPPKGAMVRKMSWRDNPWLSEAAQNERLELLRTDPEEYQHVWEGECRSNVSGAIFAAELKAADAEGRITNVPYNRARPVETVWDLGFGDLTTVWFVQAYDGWYNFIDYEEGNGMTIADWIVRLQGKQYVYGTDWLPHDGVDTIIHKRLAADPSMSIEMLLRQAGREVRIVPKVYVTDRINAGRTIFPQCRFDAVKCSDGIQALRHYQWGEPTEKERELGIGKREPLHNFASHGSDAFTEAAICIKQPSLEPAPQERRTPRYGPQSYSPFG